MRAIAGSLFLALLVPVFGQAQNAEVVAQTRRFLDAYAHQDTSTVLRSIDESTVVYGSDASEVFRGSKAILGLLADDGRLWGGAAQIGAMNDVSTESAGDLQTIFFQAPFRVAGRPAVQVRFCMVWRHAGGHWRLLQSSNAVVTEGQGAKQILKSQHP